MRYSTGYYPLFLIFVHRCLLLNKLQETWAPSDFPDIQILIYRVSVWYPKRDVLRLYIRYTGSITYRVFLSDILESIPDGVHIYKAKMYRVSQKETVFYRVYI